MIDPKELRIGNWVIFKDDSTLCNVKEIALNGLLVWIPKTKEETWIELDQFDPIELTPEILEKAGFKWETEKKRHMQKEMSEGDLIVFFYLQGEINAIQLYDGGMDMYSRVATNMKNLHQLQNLYYSLTGQELTYAP